MPPLLGNFDHSMKYSVAYRDDTGRIVETALIDDTQTAGHYTRIDETIGVISDQLLDWTVDISQLKLLMITSDGPLLIKTYVIGVLQDSFNIDSDSPIVWSAELGLANPVTADVLSGECTVTNTVASANLRILQLEDPTP